VVVHIDAEALQASLERLRQAPHEADLSRALQRVVTSMNQLFNYDGAGIMLIDQGEQLVYVASSDEVGRALEEAQAQADQGPCLDAYVNARLTSSKDVRSDARWPQLADVLDERVRAVAGVPLRLGGSPVGTVNVYRTQPAGWDDSDTAALHAFAELIEEIMTAELASQQHSETASQLQYALNYRVIIERAIGFLMASHGVDAITAFNRLRKQARDSRRRVADLAAEILGDTSPPPSA
jgi:GAF domain-containing protein